MNRQRPQHDAKRRTPAEAREIGRRLAALDQEIEEHQRWLREDPLLRRKLPQAA